MGRADPPLPRAVTPDVSSVVGRGCSAGLAVVCLLAPLSVFAATWTTSAGLQLSETFSDNIALAAKGSERAEQVTEVSPSVRLNAVSGRSSLNLDAAWHGLQYARGTSGNQSSTTLNSTGKLELLDKWLFLEGSASISDQVISPLGSQSTSLATINANRTQVRSVALTPYMSGVIGTELFYNVRSQNSNISTASADVSNSRSRGWSGGLRWGSNSRLFNLGVDASRQRVNYSAQPDTETRSTRVTVYMNPSAQLSLSAYAGRESNNYSLTSQSGPTSGVTARWTVSERTSINASLGRQPAGPTSSFSFSHRMPRSTWQLGYSRSNQTTSTGGNLNTFSAQYQSLLPLVCPDVATRQQCASTTLVPLMQQAGIPVLGQLPFVSTSSYVQRTLFGSAALVGVRNTVTLNLSRTDSINDSSTVAATDVLAGNSAYRQTSASLNWTMKVTPFSNMTGTFTRSRNDSVGAVGGGTISTSTYLLWSTQLTRTLLGSISLRHVIAQSDGTGATGASYQENAVIGTLGYTY